MIQYLELTEVSTWPYRSRNGGAIKLRFTRDDGPAFVFIHNGSAEQLAYWKDQIGRSYFIRSWLEADPANPTIHWQHYNFAQLDDLTGEPASFTIPLPS